MHSSPAAVAGTVGASLGVAKGRKDRRVAEDRDHLVKRHNCVFRSDPATDSGPIPATIPV
jgi:hypothetical protein